MTKRRVGVGKVDVCLDIVPVQANRLSQMVERLVGAPALKENPPRLLCAGPYPRVESERQAEPIDGLIGSPATASAVPRLNCAERRLGVEPRRGREVGHRFRRPTQLEVTCAASLRSATSSGSDAIGRS